VDTTATQQIDTPIGKLDVTVSEQGLKAIEFVTPPGDLVPPPTLQFEPNASSNSQAGCARGRLLAAEVATDGEVSLEFEGRQRVLLRRSIRQIQEYLAGERKNFEVELDLSTISGMQLQVLFALRTVGYGQTVSYGELAEWISRPGAARAVGTALAKNPLPLVLPCHRVLPKGGGGGYNGGIERKEWLLTLEQQRLPVAAV